MSKERSLVPDRCLVIKKVKVKWSRYRRDVAQRVCRGIALLFHDRGTSRGWVVSSTPRPHFTPGKDPVPIWQEVGWAPGPVWTGRKSRPHRNSISDRPDRSQSLYRLSYPAHYLVYKDDPQWQESIERLRPLRSLGTSGLFAAWTGVVTTDIRRHTEIKTSWNSRSLDARRSISESDWTASLEISHPGKFQALYVHMKHSDP